MMECKGRYRKFMMGFSGGLLDGSASVGAIESREILHWRQEYLLLRQGSLCSVAYRNLDPDNRGSGLL
jgi:hypothetical protein